MGLAGVFYVSRNCKVPPRDCIMHICMLANGKGYETGMRVREIRE